MRLSNRDGVLASWFSDGSNVGCYAHGAFTQFGSRRRLLGSGAEWETPMRELVSEEDLATGLFSCCGDEDLFPFKCPSCLRLMVFCYECDTLFHDLGDLTCKWTPVNHGNPTSPIFSCPGCAYAFENSFMSNPSYAVSRQHWMSGGGTHVLKPSKG